ncbi:Putative membrane protein, magnetosome protein MamI. Homolog to mamI of MV-1 [Desulfamplus magnetovallimortis]|uniref:Putative membrane protein, magnetosome protein MamI. Homolog to mamI of MV-1 n=1 Tax=Desulfamplus magnetovallimortis TaxID=1246637 RepID=L0R5A2_9BACT|nr:magnetosome protein MamI [Desulfamplus magnetovallimortis]CCO06715.1 Putative membrane protein, magnetosome protein MamI. Homolog to mamI of MV-1 [Desulfamplus magnetovallimortis BW-1]SLM32766.1 Putative membrane protein, magnetosome protein MamI. Homolog to mamI of MV-1 [Desulfamplus magnetovallimortis]
MTTIFQIMIGIILLALGVYGILVHWWALVDLASVVIPVCLVFFGVLSVLTGISTIRENRQE